MIIGICGKSGSDKSTLARSIINQNQNAVHLDIDKVGHHVLTIKEVKDELIDSYGDTIIIDDLVDRKKLSNIVFNSRKEMKRLSDITWKYMQIEIDKFLEDNKDKIIILDWILLPLSKYYSLCNYKILLDIPYEIRKERVVKRDNISEEMFLQREKASIDYHYEDFDYIIKDTNPETIKSLVKKL